MRRAVVQILIIDLVQEWRDRESGVDVVEWLWFISKEWPWLNEVKLFGTNRTMQT
jgi:hypothetical protein